MYPVCTDMIPVGSVFGLVILVTWFCGQNGYLEPQVQLYIYVEIYIFLSSLQPFVELRQRSDDKVTIKLISPLFFLVPI